MTITQAFRDGKGWREIDGETHQVEDLSATELTAYSSPPAGPAWQVPCRC